MAGAGVGTQQGVKGKNLSVDVKLFHTRVRDARKSCQTSVKVWGKHLVSVTFYIKNQCHHKQRLLTPTDVTVLGY